MKLRGWSIDGFGVFCGYVVRGLGDGLTVVVGPNEAGKSTLLAFIRNTLFGYPDGRSAEPRFPPLRGGKHGGRLFLEGSTGEYVVGRDSGQRSASVQLPGNRMGVDADLTNLLGHADKALFRAVFAFGLFELQEFDTLNAEGIRERIFSVGITGAGRSARAAIKELDKRAGEIAREFSALTNTVDDAHGRLKEARDRAVAYPALLEAESVADAERRRLDGEIERIDSDRRRCERLISAWPSFYRRNEAEEPLARLPSIENFPSDPEKRLAALTERLERRRESLAELESLQRKDESERQGMKIDDRLATIGAELERLTEDLALHTERLRKLPLLEADRRRIEDSLSELLNDLGPDWDVERLRLFDRSIPRQEVIRDWDKKIGDGHGRLLAARVKLQTAEDEQRSCSEEVRVTAERLEGIEPPAVEEIQRLDTELRSLRATLATLRDAESSLVRQVALVEDRERNLQAAESEAPLSPIRVLIAGLAVAAFSASLVGVGGNWVGAAAMLAGGVTAAALLATRQASVRRRHQARIEALRDASEAAKVGRAAFGRKADELRATALAHGSTLGIAAELSWQMVEDAEQDLRARAAERADWDRRRSDFSDVQRKLEQASRNVETCRAGVTEAESKADAVRAQWEQWKKSESLPDELTPDGVLDLFDSVRRGRAAVRELDSLRTEYARLDREVAEWESVARRLTSAESVGEPLIAEVRIQHQAYREDRELRTQVAQLSSAIGIRAIDIERAIAAVRAVESERDRLLAEAGAVDDADFHERAATFSERQRLASIVTEAERDLVNVIGLDAAAEALRMELAAGRLSEWKQGVADAENRLRELREVRDDALIQERRARADRDALEASGDVATAELECQTAIRELTDVVRRWQSIVLARELVQRTLNDYIRDRQPEVLEASSPMFCAVTGNRYQSVVQDQAGEGVLVMDAQGGVRGVDALSTGTAQQLYLAMRLALADEFEKAGTDLPLVLDDVLVNFDPSRAKAMAEVLVEYARHKQVFLFTCHPETRDALLAADPSTAVLEIAAVEPVALPAQPASSQELLEFASGAVPNPDARTVGAADGAEAVLRALEVRPLALSEIVELTQLEETRVTAVLRQLRSDGKVDVTGHARGARWQRVGVATEPE